MTEQLNDLVKDEARKLKKNAKKGELRKLSFRKLAPTSAVGCIYGQATGSCFSRRATELIEAGCKRVYHRAEGGYGVNAAELNGSPKQANRCFYWSPIEVFIAKEENKLNGNNKVLIDFLKGKTKTLKFK